MLSPDALRATEFDCIGGNDRAYHTIYPFLIRYGAVYAHTHSIADVLGICHYAAYFFRPNRNRVTQNLLASS